MAMTAGEIIWKITGDKTGFDKSIKGSEKAAKGLGKTFAGVASKIGVALAAVGFTRLIKGFVKAGSEAKEVGQKFGVVFKGITREANAMAKNLVDNFGMSTTEAKKLLGNTGDLLTGFGFTKESALDLSNQVQQLATDLSSFNNTQLDFSSEAITKGLFGETEQMKSLGIVINQNSDEFKGLIKHYTEVEGKTLNQAKAMTILQMATEQSKNAIGDFSRSQDSAANVQRRLTSRLSDMSAAIGNELLPGLESLGLAFLEISKDGTIFSKALQEIFRNISVVLSGISLVMLKFQEWQNESNLDDTIAQQKELNKELKGSVSILKSYGFTQKEINDLTEKGIQPRTRGYKDEWKAIGNIIRVQKERDKVFREGQSATKSQEGVEKALLNIRNKLANSTDAAVDAREKERQAQKKSISNNKKEKKSIEEKMTALEKFIEKTKEVASVYSSGLGQVGELFGSIGDLSDAIAERRIEALDAQMERELEAAGLLEETKEEELENDIERAEKAGKTDEAEEKKKQLARLKIEQKYQKKRAMIEYQAALMQWKFKLAFAIASVPLAIMQGLIAGLQIPVIGVVMGPVYAAIAGAAAGIQVAAVAASKPKPPSFQSGGIVPGANMAGDMMAAQVNSGEMILNGAQQKRLFDVADGRAAGGGGNITIYLGDEMIYNNLYQATRTGELIIDSRALVSV